MVEFFKGLSFFILPLGFGFKRIEFFNNRIREFGGTLNGKTTHVIIEDSVSEEKDNCLSALKTHRIQVNSSLKFVKVKWLSKCLSCKGLIDSKPFEVEWTKAHVTDLVSGEEPHEKRKKEETGEAINTFKDEETSDKKRNVEHEKFICSKPSSSTAGEPSQIKRVIIKELEKLANAYTIRNDTWRSHGYRKAINAIKLHDKDISTFQEACSIPGVGEKMALKILEIIESGKLQKVEEVANEKTKILNLFCKIWGVGPSTAEGWYVQGLSTLEDLKSKAKLTKQQQIGMKLYEDFLKRIPREEVAKIAGIVEREVSKIHSSLSVELVGSFRRGKATCGDVDIMIVVPGIKTPWEILLQLIQTLKTQGYITDDLVTLEELKPSDEENHHRKYFGVFKLPGEDETHRRIDLFVVPKSEYASALFHYTGSAMFNRSIKLLAAKKEMSLSEHGLYVGTIRKGSEVRSKGQLVSTLTEEDIFKELGLPYRRPEERDH